MLIQIIQDQREINGMNKSIERLHSYLYFILLLIITWKTMCSQICSHWLLLSSSHLVFFLIMIQILWKKSQIINYKHAQRNDNYFYQVWRFENFCDFSKNLNISWPTQSKYIPRLHWMLQKMNCFKFRVLLLQLSIDTKPHFCLIIMC